jgi:plastocyanin
MTLANWRTPLSLLLVSASLPVVAGCGGGGAGSSSTTGSTAASGSTSAAGGGAAVSAAKVDISDFAYDPETITVKAGGTVTWTNDDSAEHTATADDHSTFDTGTLNQGDSKKVTLDKPGTYTYVCSFHAFMHGTVVVE